MQAEHLCELLQITQAELRARQEFLGLTEKDADNLVRLAKILEADAVDIVREFYDRLGGHEELKRFLSDPETVHRLRESQRRYLLSLGQGIDQLDMIETRLRIGYTHERIGLKQKWYLGGYAILFELIMQRVTVRCLGDGMAIASLAITLNKVLKFDEILVVDTYYHATTHRLESTLHQLEEAQQHLQEYSRLDGLTKAFNRKYLMEALEVELLRSIRFHHPFTLLFLDFDHFKYLNDSYGHVFGDLVLEHSAALIRGVIRPSDVFGRYGGEEFAVGLVECDEESGRRIAERIRLKLARTNVMQGEVSASVTCSIGLTALRPGVDQIGTLLGEADRALYQAKSAGRNQVVSWSPQSS